MSASAPKTPLLLCEGIALQCHLNKETGKSNPPNWCLGALHTMKCTVSLIKKFKPVPLRPRAIQSDFFLLHGEPDGKLWLLKRCPVEASVRQYF